MTTAVGIDSSPVKTDVANKDALTSEDHTIDPTMTEAPTAIEEMHPTPHPANAVAHTTHQMTDAIGYTLTCMHHSSTTVIHIKPATFAIGVTLEGIPWAEANLVQDTLTILPADHIQGRHQDCIHKQQPS